MSVLNKAKKIINNIEDWLAIFTFLAMVAVVLVIVVCRYVLKVRFMMGEELARYLMIWCAYAGVAYGFRKNSHVGVVVFIDMLPQVLQRGAIILRRVLTAGVMITLFVLSCMVFNKYLSTNQVATVTKLPTAWVYIIIPIGLALGTIHSITDMALEILPKKEATQEGEGTT